MNILRKIKSNIRPRTRYITHYFPPRQFGVSNCIKDYDGANRILIQLLKKGEPCMISRFGSTEFYCMLNYMKGRHPLWWMRSWKPFWVKPQITEEMKICSGFFNGSNNAYCRFADLLYDSAKHIDILGSWIEHEKLIEHKMNYIKLQLGCLEPFFSINPWTKYLEGKKIVVVHPFKERIEKQYFSHTQKQKRLFDNPDILPKFKSLVVIKAIQSLGGKDNGYNTWFDALHHMEKQIDSVDYDVALIGCGAYGMPLAAHCKKMGKQAVHLGGGLQLLFGIRGRRWEQEFGREKFKKMLSNPYWIRPSESETPTIAKQVDDACYW